MCKLTKVQFVGYILFSITAHRLLRHQKMVLCISKRRMSYPRVPVVSMQFPSLCSRILDLKCINDIAVVENSPNYHSKSSVPYHWPVNLIAQWRLAVCSQNIKIHITRDHVMRQSVILYLILSLCLSQIRCSDICSELSLLEQGINKVSSGILLKYNQLQTTAHYNLRLLLKIEWKFINEILFDILHSYQFYHVASKITI